MHLPRVYTVTSQGDGGERFEAQKCEPNRCGDTVTEDGAGGCRRKPSDDDAEARIARVKSKVGLTSVS